MNKYVFIDVDGTIFNPKTRKIPSSTLKALNKAHENGHHLFITTGRPLSNIPESITSLPVDGLILSCGAYIIIDQKLVYEGAYDRDIIDTVSTYLIKRNIGFALEGPKKNYLYGEAVDFFKQYVALEYESDEEKMNFLKSINMCPYEDITEDDYKDILKITALTLNRDNLEGLMKILDFSRVSSFIDIEKGNFYKSEITPKGVNNATGIEFVLNYCQANHEDSIGIGDSLNDLEMIDYVNTSVVMGQATDEVKAHADIVTDTIDNDGFYKAFELLGLI